MCFCVSTVSLVKFFVHFDGVTLISKNWIYKQEYEFENQLHRWFMHCYRYIVHYAIFSHHISAVIFNHHFLWDNARGLNFFAGFLSTPYTDEAVPFFEFISYHKLRRSILLLLRIAEKKLVEPIISFVWFSCRI